MGQLVKDEIPNDYIIFKGICICYAILMPFILILIGVQTVISCFNK